MITIKGNYKKELINSNKQLIMKIAEILDKQVRNRGLNSALTFEREAVEEMLREFAKAKCEEQRQFCANYYIIRKANDKANDTISFEDIMSAPTPDFE